MLQKVIKTEREGVEANLPRGGGGGVPIGSWCSRESAHAKSIGTLVYPVGPLVSTWVVIGDTGVVTTRN